MVDDVDGVTVSGNGETVRIRGATKVCFRPGRCDTGFLTLPWVFIVEGGFFMELCCCNSDGLVTVGASDVSESAESKDPTVTRNPDICNSYPSQTSLTVSFFR